MGKLEKLRNLPAILFQHTSFGRLSRLVASSTLILSIAVSSSLALYLSWLALSIALSAEPVWEDVRNYLIASSATLGIPFLVWRTLLLAKQTEVQHERLHSDSFIQAVKLLGEGSDRKSGQAASKADEDLPPSKLHPSVSINDGVEINLEVRVGAIYAISRIASSSEIYYWQAIETLVSYLRRHSREPFDYLSEEDFAEASQARLLGEIDKYRQIFSSFDDKIYAIRHAYPYPREDIQTAISVISGKEGGEQFRAASTNRRVRLGNTILQQSDMKYCKLRGCSFQAARAERVDFRFGDLRDADFYFARLDGCTVRGADFRGSNLCCASMAGVDYHGEKEEFEKMLDSAFGDEWTVLPPDIQRPAHWAKGLTAWQQVYDRWHEWRDCRNLSKGFKVMR